MDRQWQCREIGAVPQGCTGVMGAQEGATPRRTLTLKLQGEARVRKVQGMSEAEDRA